MNTDKPSKVYIVVLHNHFDDYKIPDAWDDNTIELVTYCKNTAYRYAVLKNIDTILEDIDSEGDDEKTIILESVLRTLDEVVPEENEWKDIYRDLRRFEYKIYLNNQESFTGKVSNRWYFIKKSNITSPIVDDKEEIKEFARKYSRKLRDDYKLPECTYDEDGYEC